MQTHIWGGYKQSMDLQQKNPCGLVERATGDLFWEPQYLQCSEVQTLGELRMRGTANWWAGL